MKRLVGLALGAAFVAATPAFGDQPAGTPAGTAHGSAAVADQGSTSPPRAMPAVPGSAPVIASAAPCPQTAAAPAVTYVDQCITTYECVTKSRKVDVTVYRPVQQEVPFEYQEMQQVTKTVKQPCVVQRMVTREVPFEYQEMQQVTKTVKQPYVVNRMVTREVPFEYQEMQQVTKTVKQPYVVNRMVTREVPFEYTAYETVQERQSRPCTTYQAVDTLVLDLAVGPLEKPTAVNMGNPHAVFFVADAEAVPLEELGPQLESHPLFPERANIGVAEVRGEETIRLRVFERGVGLTSACGSGACAALVAAARRGIAGPKASLLLDGGKLQVHWTERDRVLMTGPASLSYTGELAPELLA